MILTHPLFRRIPALGLSVLFALIASHCAAATLYVSPLGSDDNSGTVAAPYKTIKAAVDNAASGDTISLAYAIYQGNGNRDIDFAGKSLSIVSQSGRGKAILDCQGTEQEPHRAFYFHSKEKNILLDGLTIKNTRMQNMQGGIDIDQGCTVKLHQCGFRDNTSGCVYNNGTVTFIDCLFLSNPRGGCVQNGGTVTLTDCTFTSNNDGSVHNGGTATLTGCTFNANTSGNGDGGGVSSTGTAALTGCTFSGNSTSHDGGGGGLYADMGTVTLSRCTFSGNNSGRFGGGGAFNRASTVTLTDCTFTDNTSSGDGGGFNNNDIATVSNCIISGNTTTNGNGGGMSNRGTAKIRFCSFLGNVVKTATNDGTVAQGGRVRKRWHGNPNE